VKLIIMKKSLFLKYLLAYGAVGFLAMGCSGSQTTSSIEELSPSDTTFSLAVTNTPTATCTVTGSGNRVLDSGVASDLSYNVVDEEMVVVTCGDQAAVVPIGQTEVALSSTTTTIANQLDGVNLNQGTQFVTSAMARLIDDTDNQASDDFKTSVLTSIREWLLANDAMNSSINNNSTTSALQVDDSGQLSLKAVKIKPTEAADIATRYVTNWGDAALRLKKNVDCTNGANSSFPQTSCEDASIISVDKEWAFYNKKLSATHLNDPKSVPPVDARQFDLYYREGSSLDAIYNAAISQKYYTFEQVYNLLFTDLGVTATSEDSSGTITTLTIPPASEVKDFFVSQAKNWQQTIQERSHPLMSYITGQKFHVVYNPSAGPALDGTYELVDTSVVDTSSCFDVDTLDSCPLVEKRYDLNSDNTITENTNGDYILEKEYRGTGFTGTFFLRLRETGNLIRDSNYQILTYTLDPDDYGVGFIVNKRHDSALDPVLCSDDTTGAFVANAETDCPGGYSLVENAFVYPNPDKLATFLYHFAYIQNFDRMTAIQATALIKMVLQGMVAVPIDEGQTPILHGVIQPHTKTATEVDALLKTFYDNGSSISTAYGAGDFMFEGTSFGFKSNKKFKDKVTIRGYVRKNGKSVRENIKLTSSLVINPQSVNVSNGIEYPVSGTLTMNSPTYGEVSFSPTKLWVYKNADQPSYSGRTGRFSTTDGNFYLTISVSEKSGTIMSAVENNSTVEGRFSVNGIQQQ
jgi:hypothetical protein